MNARPNYTLIGIFVLSLGAALIAGILWLSVGGPGEDYDTYAIYTDESVAGLGANATVLYKGVEVGQVRQKGLAPEAPTRVRILVGVRPGTPIRTDTVAVLERRGLTGIGYINLKGEDPDAPPLTAEPGEEYPAIPSRPSFMAGIQDSASELIANLDTSARRLNTLLDDENRAALARILRRFDTLSQTLAERRGQLTTALDDFSAAMHDARETGARLPDLVDRMARAADAAEETATELSAAGKAIEATARTGGEDLRRFTRQTLPEARQLVRNLNDAARDLRRMSDQLARDPSILLYGTPTREPGPGEARRQ